MASFSLARVYFLTVSLYNICNRRLVWPDDREVDLMTAYGTVLKKTDVPMMKFGESALFIVGETDQLAFGIIELEVGKEAGYDAGHKNADEVFYLVSGTAKISYPTTGESVTVAPGEFTLIHRSLPHVIANVGDDFMKLLFACCADRDA